MRIFLAGATGYIGAGVLDALVRAGHDVTALVRNNEKARHVAERGAHPAVGNLAEPDSFRDAVEGQDGYIHAAFDSSPGGGPSVEQTAVATMIAAAQHPRGNASHSSRFVIYTSGVWILRKSPDPATEASPINPIT